MTKTHGFKLEHDTIRYFNQKLMRKNFYSGKAARRSVANSRKKRHPLSTS